MVLDLLRCVTKGGLVMMDEFWCYVIIEWYLIRRGECGNKGKRIFKSGSHIRPCHDNKFLHSKGYVQEVYGYTLHPLHPSAESRG